MKYLSHVTTPAASFRRGEFFPWISVNHCKAIVGSYVGVLPIVAVLLIGVLAAITGRKNAEPRQG